MTRPGLTAVLIALALGAGPPATAATATPAASARTLHAVIADFDRFQRGQDPVSAGLEGDRAALRLWPDDSPPAIARRAAALRRFHQRLAALSPARLGAEDELNRAFLIHLVDDQLEGLGFDQEREPFSSDNGPFDTADYVARTTVVRSRDDAEAWLSRLAALPAYYDIEIADARRGVATGFTQPRATAAVVLAAARGRAAQAAEDSPLLLPFRTLPDAIAPADQAALRARALALVTDRIKPKEAAYVAMLRDEYLPGARDSLAARALPDGERYYGWLARHYTTTSLTPRAWIWSGVREVVV